MRFKVIRIGQNSDNRDAADLVLVAVPDWNDGRLTFRLPDDAPLLKELRYGSHVEVDIKVVQ